MADDTNTDDSNIGPLLAELAQYGVGSAGVAGANKVTQAAYAAILKNLKDRFGEYAGLSPADYKQLVAQKLGPSALEGIQPDAQTRTDEQAAIAQLDDIAKSGGLTLADKEALNRLEQTQSRAAGARNASTANQYAARGQLGSGQQLAMELAANQNATQNANASGEGIAAEAQKRAMQAVLEKGKASHDLSSEDIARKTRAAEAADAIAKYNASMATDASKYNNNIAGQTYDDTLRKLSGENAVTTNLNTALLGSGKQEANAIAGQTSMANGLIGGLAGAAKGYKSGGGGATSAGGGDGGSDGGVQDSGVSPGAGEDTSGAIDQGGGSDGGGDGGIPDSVSFGAGDNVDTGALFSDTPPPRRRRKWDSLRDDGGSYA